MSLLADLQASIPLAKKIKEQREMIFALRDELELVKAQLAFANARLAKEHQRQRSRLDEELSQVIDIEAIRRIPI